MTIGPETKRVLDALRAHIEYNEDNTWGVVYLDNARPKDMKPATFRSYLAKLSQHGLYQPLDGYAFGKVNTRD
jgi:hypothetical protein